MLQSSGIAIATVHSILIVADIVGHCLVCGIIRKHRNMRYLETKITKISQPVCQTETLLKAYTTTSEALLKAYTTTSEALLKAYTTTLHILM